MEHAVRREHFHALSLKKETSGFNDCRRLMRCMPVHTTCQYIEEHEAGVYKKAVAKHGSRGRT
eukprot:6188613-Pleurochrysis_carterae.AAC.3